MSTGPRELAPPAVSPDDAGPWSIVSPVRHQQAAAARVRVRRLAEPPFGFVSLPPPRVAIPLAGLDPSSTLAGVGTIRVIAAAREAAHSLAFDEDGNTLRAVAPHARRSWALPGMERFPEQRDGTDPAAGLPAPVDPARLGEDLSEAVVAPGGEVVAVAVRDGRATAVAVVGRESKELIRWLAGARAAAWNADGSLFAVGGDWGVILCARRDS